MPKNPQTSKGSRSYKTKTYKIEIKREIQKAHKLKVGINSSTIDYFVGSLANFLGVFAQDQLFSLSVKSFPVFLIVNFDSSDGDGTHWIALRLSKRAIEIFDPLGFNISRWPNVPHYLLDFLHTFSTHRHIFISPELQPTDSTLCGFYCIFFVIFRQTHSFFSCTNYFSATLTHNDKLLTNFFNKL